MQSAAVIKIIIILILVVFVDQCFAEPLINKNYTVAAKIAKFQAEFNFKAANVRFTPPPNRDAEGPLSVHAYLYILDRFIIDTYEHSVTFSMVLCTQWVDKRLVWEHESAPTSIVYTFWVYVWSPRIRFSNTINAESTVYVPVHVDSDGIVMRCQVYDIIAPCSFDLSAFPNDVHNCSLSFSSINYGSHDIIFEPWITESEISSSEWKLLPSARALNVPQPSTGNISTVVVDLQIRRQPHLYGFRVYLAMRTSHLLLALTILAPESCRISLTYMLLLTTCLQHGFLATMTRSSTETPRILWQSSASVFLSLVTVCSSLLRSSFRPSKLINTLKRTLSVLERCILLSGVGLLVVILLFQ
ncbi:5-hydroxytryptamine receptor 3B-like isoform X1 [Varroa destructor]|uniref:Neurotransmitter-gated ion-channel ligand-binding domain-containing protein n=1 Tax=Varroa destructor TaxID=109461 RepID=A0A7M7JZ01_VARDE|nr:5-hydroxytryptamine receptor 3B-like isoform X1 [Varroa destructor]XP_022654872.1 5-hydroxytryptamine receptor 3B-like isoform X1 [Varroa destructor]